MSNSGELDAREYAPSLELLRKIDFLEGVPDEDLKSILFSLQKQVFAPSRTILFQGEISNRLFIVRKGSVLISIKNRGEKLRLAELTPPMYFGEISLLTPSSATATVASGEEGADLLILSHESFNQLSKKLPDIRERIQTVIQSRLSAAKEARKSDDS